MRLDRRSSSALTAVFAALLIAVPALAATGGDGSGGTPTKPPPEVGPSGGVPGPGTEMAEDADARAAQDPDEEPPQIEPPDETETTPEPAPDEETGPEETAPDEDAETAPEEGSGTAPTTGGGGGGLPNTGLELASMAAVGLALVLAGWVLHRRPRGQTP